MKRLCSIAFVLAFGASAIAQETASEPVIIPRADSAPAVDGKLDDVCWQKALVLKDFTVAEKKIAPVKPVEARLCFDDNAVYVAVRSAEPELDKLKAIAFTKDDEVWDDDCVEIWLQPAADPMNVNHYVVNSISVFEASRHVRGLQIKGWTPAGEIKSGKEDSAWTVEMRIPAQDLQYESLRRGDLMGLKIQRSDKVTQPNTASIWPAGVAAGREEGFANVVLENSTIPAGVQTTLRPGALYEFILKSSGRGAARIVLTDATSPTRLGMLDLKRADQASQYAIPFVAPESGNVAIIGETGADVEPAEVIESTHIRRIPGTDMTGRGAAIPITPGGDPYMISKVRVIDSRVVRAFTGSPVDGSVKSGSWDGRTWEYPIPNGGVGVRYHYMNDDGLHLTLVDDAKVNAVMVRGGIKSQLISDVQNHSEPESGQLLHQFPGGAIRSRAYFEQPISAKKMSFYEVGDGLLADVSFFRVQRGLGDLRPEVIADAQVDQQDAKPRALPQQRTIVLTSQPLKEETSIGALGLDFQINSPGSVELTTSVEDPLNSRLELHGADYTVTGNGRVNLVLDFPDQVVPAGKTLKVTLKADQSASISDIKFEQYRIPKEQAIVEALEHRKFLLHAFYTPVSEARPWNVWREVGSDVKYLNGPLEPKSDLQNRLRPWVKEIVMSLEQCRALDPEGKDPIVRQMHEWMYQKIITKRDGELPRFPTKFNQIEGVPEWASLVHQAWMQAREVPNWWIANRLAPNGEFGGVLGDDTDMYQNYAPFPMFERDGVGGMMLDAGARMAELIDEKNMEHGTNKYAMDPLHAYEEGLNQQAMMSYWFYGDPIYIERNMVGARTTEMQTVVTEKGHRHFRNGTLGSSDVEKPRPLQGEHGSHCLMWHPTLVYAWYTRHPAPMQWLSEWGLGWLDHMQRGQHATAIKLPEDVIATREFLPVYFNCFRWMLHDAPEPLPFQGGWGMTGTVFMHLADLTGDARFIQPYTDYLSFTGKNTSPHAGEMVQLGMLPENSNAQKAAQSRWDAVLYQTGNKEPMIRALKRDIEELQRFPYMYTAIECFTDRVFLYAAINPSIAYTGGHTTRNKLNLNYAVSWNGFGTDYAALVTKATAQNLKVLLCNISDRPISGAGTIWRLEPGEYELTFGPDANNDDQPDQIDRKETITITRGDEIMLLLPPKVVQVLELKQLRKGESIFERADLALAARELKLESGKLKGIAHNIGTRDVSEVTVSLLDANDNVVQEKKLGTLAAPMDLLPKTIAFEFEGVAPGERWSVMLDHEGKVDEIYEGNNRASVSQ